MTLGSSEGVVGVVYTPSIDPVLAAEREALRLDNRSPTGLAFSGGGIRSATFGLGIAQALANHGLLEQFDYLSTASGGGYLGAAITWMRRRWTDGVTGLGEPNVSARSAAQSTSHPWLNYLRQHGNYLLPNTISPLALVGIALRGATVSLMVYFTLLLAAMMAFVRVRLLAPPITHPGNIVEGASALVLAGISSFQHWSFPRAIATPIDRSSTFIQGFLLDWNASSICICFAAFYVIGCVVYSMATLVSSFTWAGKGWPAPSKWKDWATCLVDLRALLFAMLSGTLLLGAQFIAALAAATAWRKCSDAPSWFGACAPQQGMTIALSLMMVGTILVLIYILVWRSCSWYYRMRVVIQQRAGALLGLIIGFGILASVPVLHVVVTHWMSAVTAGNLMTLLGSAGAVYQAMQGRGTEQVRSWSSQLIIIVASALVIYGMLLLAYATTGIFYANGGMAGLRVGIVIAITLAVIVGVATNLNFFNLGRMYRDRLMETFQASGDAVTKNQWTRSDEADAQDLSESWPASSSLASGKVRNLYPLINTSAVLVDAASDKFRNRGTDSFLLSPLFCGSDATGWVGTKHFADRHLTLATAIATSGAAINPHAAGGGRGITRDRLVSFLMFLFQVRLGTWVLNPNLSAAKKAAGAVPSKQSLTRWVAKHLMGQRPNFLVPGVRGGLLGRGASERAPFVELTDGGHFDNTGLYELLRRECTFMVLSQSSADPDYTLDDLANAIEKSRVDFAVEITFRPQYPVSHLLPTEPDKVTGLHFARCSFAIADVRYESGKTGVLVYLQSTRLRGADIKGNASAGSAFVHEDVLTYARQHSTFPNETTLDQFFTEPQLEAYRELGYVATRQMLNTLWGQDLGRTDALTIEAWMSKTNAANPGSATTAG